MEIKWTLSPYPASNLKFRKAHAYVASGDGTSRVCDAREMPDLEFKNLKPTNFTTNKKCLECASVIRNPESIRWIANGNVHVSEEINGVTFQIEAGKKLAYKMTQYIAGKPVGTRWENDSIHNLKVTAARQQMKTP